MEKYAKARICIRTDENISRVMWKLDICSNELNTLNFIKEKENIILIVSPDSGKTHYSIGLGIKVWYKGLV